MGRRLYRLLAGLMPEAFRREFGDEMCRVAEEQWRERASFESRGGALRFWTRQSFALLRAAAGLHRHEHETGGGWTMEGFGQDLKQGARALLRRPGFSLLMIVTLALGIGATTATFSAIHTVLLRPLPYADSDRVAVLFRSDAASGERGDGVAAANIRDLRERSTLLESVAVAEPWSLDLRTEDRVESLRTWAVGRGFFEAIGGQPLLGRTFTETDHDEGGAGIVVVSHRTWLNRFGADPAVLGQSLALDDQAMTVVGIMPAEFRFPDAAEMWIPRPDQPWDEQSRAADFMTGVARLSDGATREQAQAELTRIAADMASVSPRANGDLDYDLVPLREHLFGTVQTPLTVIMAAVAFVLLIACANVAGLILARGAQRERDFALRGALGAGTSRLMGHVVAETVILASIGSVLGVAIAYGGIQVIRGLGPDHLPRIEELSIDRTVLAFAATVSVLAALVSSLAPSIRLSRPDLRDALCDGSRGASAGMRKNRARSRLVVTQVAAAVVLLAGAGLLLRSFGTLLDQDLGFDPSDRLVMQVFAYDYESPQEAKTVIDGAVDAMLGIPGITGVAYGSDIPGATDGVIAKIDVTLPYTIADRTAPPAGQEPIASFVRVSPGYFDVLDIDLVEGRDFDASDRPGTTPVIIVNAAFARRQFGESSPLGEQIVIGADRTGTPREVVGVVADTRPLGHASEPRPEFYVPIDQSPTGSLTFVIRTIGDAENLLLPAMETIWEANPAQSVYGATTMEALVSTWLTGRRFNLFLLGSFSLIALALSAIGLYGLISFSVERRMGELGIRRALGGHDRDLIAMVLREGATLAGAGLAIGLGVAWYLSRFMRSMLFGVAPTDMLTLVALAGLVLLIALIATVVPAIRAVRVDPVVALRSD